jgi:hypothetical protein
VIGHTARAEAHFGRPLAAMPALAQRTLAELDAADSPLAEYLVAVTAGFCEALDLDWDAVAALVDEAARQHLRGSAADHERHHFTETLDGLLADRFGRTWPDELLWRLAHAATVYLRPERDDGDDEPPPAPRGPSTDPATWVALA